MASNVDRAADCDAEACARMLAEEADRRGTSIEIHRCPRGDWIIGFGEGVREVLAQEADFGNALFAATVLPRDAEGILGERFKAACEILADCRRFVNHPPTVQGADLLRRIDAYLKAGAR